MPWYGGESLLEHLESVPAANGVADGPARLPVQYVIRADGTRWYAGRLGSGTLRVGDEVVVLPSGQRTRVAAFEDGSDVAAAPRSVAVALGRRARRRPRRPARPPGRGARARPRADAPRSAGSATSRRARAPAT